MNCNCFRPRPPSYPQTKAFTMNGNSNSDPKFLNLSQSQLQQKYDDINSRFQNASNEHQLQDLVSEIDNTSDSITSEMKSHIASNLRTYQNEISKIELQRTKLTGAIESSSELTKIFSNANDLGHSLTYKLKVLDKEIGQVNHTLDYVSKVKLLKNNINQTMYALEHNNWELAAKCIHTIRKEVPESLIEGKYASVVIPSTDIPELPGVVINNTIKQLITVFQQKFNEAADSRDIVQLTTYFQLFPLIGEEEVGLNCYSRFICKIITDTLRSLVQAISGTSEDGSKKSGLYSRSSMQLFENISLMLSQHAPLIKKYYSSTYEGAIILVITKIQLEIDSQIGLITDTFYDVNRISKVLQDIALYKFPILSKRLNDHHHNHSHSHHNHQKDTSEPNSTRQSFDDEELVTIVKAGDLMNELSGILNYWILYCKFITLRYFNEPQQSKLLRPELITNSNFTKKITTKYLPAFEALFLFYFRRSIEKAITIEELPPIEPYLVIKSVSEAPDQPPCSSVIEDISLVLNTCLRNTINSGQLDAVKSFVTNGYKVIQNDLLDGYFLKNLNDNLPRYNSALSLISSHISSGLNDNYSPRGLRSSTPQTGDHGSSMGFFKGASSAFGNVVGTGASSVAGATSSSGVANNKRLANFIIYLNTVAIGQEYFQKVIKNFMINDSSYIKNYFVFGEDHEIISTILKSDILEPFVNVTNKIIQEGLINFYNQSIKNRLLQMIGEFFSDSDESNYLIYSTSALNDNSLIINFTNDWRGLIRPYKQLFHHELIFNKLLRLIVLNVANYLERRLLFVLKKIKINELGALKLEKDVSTMISEVCEDNYELREKFIRVTQLVLLVGMDDEEYEFNQTTNREEEEEEEEDLGINWVFTPQERKQFRKFRI